MRDKSNSADVIVICQSDGITVEKLSLNLWKAKENSWADYSDWFDYHNHCTAVAVTATADRGPRGWSCLHSEYLDRLYKSRN